MFVMDRAKYPQVSDSMYRSTHAMGDLTVSQAWCIYLSHFLSMWTSRMYEYGTILFIQHIFPGDLLASSINGIAETVCVLVSSTTLGQWVDRSPTRLRPLIVSIITNRTTVAICCCFWLLAFSVTSSKGLQQVLFVSLLLLGMVEKASRMSNTLSMERDWIPTVAGSRRHHCDLSGSDKGEGEERGVSYSLTHLNTVVRRIDIFCKFLAPLTVSSMMAWVQPWLVASFIAVVGIISSVIEVWSALYVWRSNSRLREAKSTTPDVLRIPPRRSHGTTTIISGRLSELCSTINKLFWAQVDGFEYYFRSEVWIPSLGTAILHASVLVWSGTLITWCLNANFSYGQITIAKGIGSLVEISSTFVFPLAVSVFEQQEHGTRKKQSSSGGGTYQMVRNETDDDHAGTGPANTEDTTQIQTPDDNHQPFLLEDTDSTTLKERSAVIMTAKYGIIGLSVTIIPALIALFALDKALVIPTVTITSSTPSTSPSSPANGINPFSRSPAPTIFFFLFLSLSFLGRWTYDLSITQLTQVAIPPTHRSGFGGTEMALVSVVSLIHWVAATVWHAQKDFKWLATGSVVGVVGATGAYCLWVTRTRNVGRRGR